MNIALCTDIFIPHMGGIETAMNALANEYVQKGHKRQPVTIQGV